MAIKNNIVRGVSALLLGASLLAQGTNALAGIEHVVRIENDGSQSIFRVYASNTGDPDWGRDRLGDGVIIPGRSTGLDLDDGSGRCRVDLRVVFRNGQEVIRRDVNICDVETWRIDDFHNGFVFV